MIYLLDTNAVSDLLRQEVTVVVNRNRRFREGHTLALSPPVYYESLRGLLKANALLQINRLREQVLPLVQWTPLADADWVQAAQLWADTKSKGKQLSDIDLLIAALAYRLSATIVSSDDDFDVLPIARENWRVML